VREEYLPNKNEKEGLCSVNEPFLVLAEELFSKKGVLEVKTEHFPPTCPSTTLISKGEGERLTLF